VERYSSDDRVSVTSLLSLDLFLTLCFMKQVIVRNSPGDGFFRGGKVQLVSMNARSSALRQRAEV